MKLFQFGGAVLNGNEQEVYQFGTKTPSVPCWGNWRSEDPAASEFYQTEIYPICMNIVESMSRAYGPGCKVLDVGGGDGTLALELAQLPNISKVDVIDSSVKQTQLLKKRIGCDCHWLSPKAKSVTNVHMGDLTQKTGWASIQDTRYQVIIISGVLADQVIAERDQINFILNRCKNHLAPQGVIVIASYSNSRVNSALLKEHTLNVLNQSRVPSMSPFIIEPFYVASQE